jgi:CheY-like chemotaxis protein
MMTNVQCLLNFHQKYLRLETLQSENIVLFTASPVTDKEVQEMLLTGAKAVLKKPISIDDLIETVERFSQDGNQ